MPKNQSERLQLINGRLKRPGLPVVAKRELMELCECSERTLKADLALLREAHGAPVVFHRKEVGYQYTGAFDLDVSVRGLSDRELARFETALATLRSLPGFLLAEGVRPVLEKLERAFRHSFQGRKGDPSPLLFEHVPYFKGTELIGPLVEAIRTHRQVQFGYQKFGRGASESRLVEPLVLKEHRNRWYLLARDPTPDAIRSFGLDRIVENSFQVEESFAPTTFDAFAYFRNVYGIFVRDSAPVEDVVLSFSGEQIGFFKTQPFFWNEACEVLIDVPSEYRVRLAVVVNDDLIMELARLGNRVRVLAPESLREKVRTHLRNALTALGG